MTETFELFPQPISAATCNATSSLASADSPTPPASRPGRMMHRCGPGASPASRSASPATSARRPTTVTSGRNCIALLHKRDPLYFWARTLLASSRWGSMEFSLTWKAKATPAGRLLFQLAPSTPRTGEIGSGSSGAVWPTATANDPEKRGDFAAERRNGLPGIAKAVWSTPRASDGEKGGPNHSFGSGATPPLPAQAVWATPTTRDHKDASSVGSAPVNGMLGRQVEPSPAGGFLNPEFVFWLMGYPPEFLACAPPVTRSSRKSPPRS